MRRWHRYRTVAGLVGGMAAGLLAHGACGVGGARAALVSGPRVASAGNLPLAPMHLDLLRLRRLRLGQRQREHAVLVARLGLIRIDGARQRHRAMERDGAPLAHEVVLPFLVLLRAAFASDRQGVAVNVDRKSVV